MLTALAGTVGCSLTGQLDAAPERHDAAGGFAVAAAAAPAADPALRAAVTALTQGRAWRAASLLAPALADSARRTPPVLLLAADIAVADGAWSRARSYLDGEAPWLDTLDQGRPRALRARIALARGDAAAAVVEASRALAWARESAARARRMALLAAALERAGRLDSARAVYDGAADSLPELADWLRLRAAKLDADSAARASRYGTLRLAAARARAPWVEANVLARARRYREAAERYDSLGAPLDALRMRILAARGRELTARRRELVSFIDANAGTDDARAAVDLFDASFRRHTAAEELVVARSAAASGPLSRSARAYARALGGGRGTAHDRVAWAHVLARLGRTREASRVLTRVSRKSSAAGEAALERARILLRRRQRRAASKLLAAIVKVYPKDTAVAAAALSQLADMAATARRDALVRRYDRQLVARYPTSPLAPQAAYRAAILALAAGQARSAATELDAMLEAAPKDGDAVAARYWSGRAWARLHDSTKAMERWKAVMADAPQSYYAVLAARRLGIDPWTPEPAQDDYEPQPGVDSALARADLLDEIGLALEARLEYDELAREAADSPERLLATGHAFREHGLMVRAISLGRRAVDLGASDARAWRLLYPLVDADVIGEQARQKHMDPALVAAIVRQESNFNPRATSSAGARGLMQVMPRIGKAIARAEDMDDFSTEQLYLPEVNVRIGVAHLEAYTGHYDSPLRALAAYNAGSGRVSRWSRMRGAKDPELFVERIPFDETRDYVKIVTRGWEMYRTLYAW